MNDLCGGKEVQLRSTMRNEKTIVMCKTYAAGNSSGESIEQTADSK
jgi:hypothetical protein